MMVVIQIVFAALFIFEMSSGAVLVSSGGHAEIKAKLGHLASKLLILKMSAGEILIHITGPWTYDPCPKLA